ncbi:hypothetical protein A2533_02265 [Candidatus Falkowbacteria bacterium RIFOXYD2_FULL_35_9]|uniref:EamA domain-containing protein n=1 Tax=Candidatus Falkowbacteria bacterium RIFOXYC2_FULL_36_12 TaxID=1798002 RepID=A0A1F5SZU3_9BACT|nr:MAG: hypothetical protein A2478_02775 [Candidatus Falkowbacteria bacterium RIFOXYC2_FULL_36_12]OGF33220.1 MAG: hypothetical protein A2223_01425 [Candidatus Falkowbacteria bacterium RIFOXYA2_FULL_35_8]OGF48329.1 MAG: hypothetical protein A2533_02265 [Candidatus Falkowbacteria bacterium RIFOXYD2_FULL_35_9]
MTWILYTLGAILLWTVVNVLDKHIISDDLKDPKLVTTLFGVQVYLLYIIFALINGSISAEWTVIVWSMISGLVYSSAIYYYYTVMQDQEVTRFVPLFALTPAFIAIVAYFMFGEKLDLIHYVAIFIIMVGAVVLTHEKKKKTKNGYMVLFLTMLTVLLFSTHTMIFDYTLNFAGVGPILFWFGIGGLILPLILYIFHHPHIKAKAKQGVSLLIVVITLSAIGMIFLIKALAIGSVVLITALIATKPLLVFLLATFLSFTHPKFIREKHSMPVLIQKGIGIVLIVIGGVMIVI